MENSNKAGEHHPGGRYVSDDFLRWCGPRGFGEPVRGSLVSATKQGKEQALELLAESRGRFQIEKLIKTPECKEVSAPRLGLTYCNLPKRRSWSNGGVMVESASI